MSAKIVISVMGPGESASPEEDEAAYALGKAIAKEGWVLVTGGRAFGVMEAAMMGANDHGGLTIGILPFEKDEGSSPYASIKILTGMGSARNNINVLTGHVIVVCGMAAGTASEVALAIKADKKIILLNQDETTIAFFRKIGHHRIVCVNSVEDAMDQIRDFVALGQIH